MTNTIIISRDPYSSGLTTREIPHANMTPTKLGPRDSRSLPTGSKLTERSFSTDSVYTIVIRLPPNDCNDGTATAEAPSIKMIPEDIARVGKAHINTDYNFSHSNNLNRRPSTAPDVRIPLNARIIPKHLAGKALLVNATKTQGKRKKKTQEKKADKKAAKTLSAILLTFIITWTPYNILVLLKPFTLSQPIPPHVWDFFYYLCYINSTINPMCYALCNASFRRTYLRILQCKWHNRNRGAVNRGFYN